MKPKIMSMLSFVSVLLFSLSLASAAYSEQYFLQCLYYRNFASISEVTYTRNNSLFLSVLNFSMRNLRFMSSDTHKPHVIVTPVNASQVKRVIYCAKRNGLQIRVRGGGHDFEGLSCTSQDPFVLIDMINLRSITVDADEGTAWVEAGANLGELYYSISQASRTLGFPGGIFPMVGVGGHISGAGYGNLIRKYGVAADHIIDACFMDANGKILNRTSMGEDLFWAIRGGGGSSFGVILAYKLRLVPIPETVTVFIISRTSEQKAIMLLQQWQSIAPKFHENLTLRISINRVKSSPENKTTTRIQFFATFLGRVDRLLELTQQSFPELGLVKQDCTEMSWIDSVLYFSRPPGLSPEVLLNRRTLLPVRYFKGKSDFISKPISIEGLQGLWKMFNEEEAQAASLDLTPYGGIMEDIPESKIAFPHRAGNLYMILYLVEWDRSQGTTSSQRYIDWINRVYSYMTPYVSKSPRASFFPYRDLDLGVNNRGNTSYEQASIWGLKYFKTNFKKLALVKTKVDPENIFRDEQSIPCISSFFPYEDIDLSIKTKDNGVYEL